VIAWLFGLLVLFLGLGMPIAFSMGLAAALALLLDGSVPVVVLAQRFYSSLDSFPLLAIPLFVLAGAVMNASGITDRLIGLSRALVGHLRGGTGQVTIVTSLLFSTISGSAAAACAAVGGMLVPAMRRDGWSREDAAVITAAAAVLGPIVPPSVLMVIYGSITGLSVGKLFLTGIGPGLVMAGVLMATVWRRAGRLGVAPHPRTGAAEAMRATARALPALLMPAIIVGGIVSGVFTATEAGAIAVGYGVLYGLATRSATAGALLREAAGAALSASAIMVILGGAALFGWIMAREGVPVMIAEELRALTSDPALVMALILAALLAVGIFIEPIPAIVMLVPVLAPVGEAYGFDAYHFAFVITYALLLGSLSPPVAVLVLIACRIAGVDYARTTRPLLPLFGALVAVLVAAAYLPGMTLAIPALFE